MSEGGCVRTKPASTFSVKPKLRGTLAAGRFGSSGDSNDKQAVNNQYIYITDRRYEKWKKKICKR